MKAVLRTRRPLDEEGASMAEFVIVIFPFLALLLGIMQLGMASMARLSVSYAAFCAARAAIVVIPTSSASSSSSGVLSTLYSLVAEEQENRIGWGSNSRLDFAVSSKAGLMRNAASYAMIPSSPAIDVVSADIKRNWGPYWKAYLAHGINPASYLKSLVGDLAGLPSAML